MQNKDYLNEDEEGEGEQSGAGGSAGEILFRFPDLITQRRDDLLPPHEIKRLLLVEKDLHKTLINKQKNLLKERKALKEGKKLHNAANMGQGVEVFPYKPHPKFENKPQFSGADPKVVGVPSLNKSDTNNENKNKNELKMNPRPQQALKNSPRSLPKPTPFK